MTQVTETLVTSAVPIAVGPPPLTEQSWPEGCVFTVTCQVFPVVMLRVTERSSIDLGYRWLDSDAPGGPVFAWEEIAGVGTRLFGSADDSVTTLRLPFPFTFYGNTFNSFRACSNGLKS